MVAHDAPASARPSEPLALAFVLDQPERVASAYLHYRPIGAATYRAMLLQRDHDTYLRGVLPAEVMRAFTIKYPRTLPAGARKDIDTFTVYFGAGRSAKFRADGTFVSEN